MMQQADIERLADAEYRYLAGMLGDDAPELCQLRALPAAVRHLVSQRRRELAAYPAALLPATASQDGAIGGAAA